MKYAFVHIPKNAGTSVSKAIKNSNQNILEAFGHSVRIQVKLRDYRKIYIIRNPFDRFASSFFYLKQYAKNRNSIFQTPTDLIDGLLEFRQEAFSFLKVYDHFHMVNGKKIFTDWTFHPQKDWLIDPYKVMIYENLENELLNLQKELKITLVVNHLNKSPQKKPFTYEKKHKDFIRLYYGQDIEIYNRYAGIKL